MYSEISLDAWPGKVMFEHFNALDMPFFALTAPLDVSRLLPWSKEKGVSFFSLCLYGITHGVNAVEAFRYRTLADGRVVLHDTVETGYIIALPDTRITALHAPLHTDFSQFCAEQKHREAQALQCEPHFPAREDRGVVFHSCIPWMSFTECTHPVNTGTRYDSIPRLTTGRHARQHDGSVTMPFNMHMHHGFVDGRAAAALVDAIETVWRDLLQRG